MDQTNLEWLNMARIDIKNQGEGNDLKLKVIEGKHYELIQPQWFSKEGIGYVLETFDKHQVLELECQGNGNLLIRLQGVNRYSTKGTRLPLWVDYTRLTINGEVIFWEVKPQWHDKSYCFTRYVNDGEKIKVEISWAYHGYKGEELSQLLSLWFGI